MGSQKIINNSSPPRDSTGGTEGAPPGPALILLDEAGVDVPPRSTHLRGNLASRVLSWTPSDLAPSLSAKTPMGPKRHKWQRSRHECRRGLVQDRPIGQADHSSHISERQQLDHARTSLAA